MEDVYFENPKPDSHYEYIRDTRPFTVKTKEGAFSFMDQIYDGWCTHQKASILIDIIMACSPKVIVEIGVWGGKSLVPMAYALAALRNGKIYGIDPWEASASLQGVMHEGSRAFWNIVDHEEVMQKLVDFLRNNSAQAYKGPFDLDRVELIRSTSIDAPPIYDIDILHIDGNHSDITSYIDVTKWVPLVRKGGWIIFDDMNWSENGMNTTGRAIEYLNKHCHKIAEISDICLWGIWYKP